MTRQIGFAIPGALDTLTGGYRYDAGVINELRTMGIVVDVINLASTFPAPSSDDLIKAASVFAGLPVEMPVIIDGLAFGAMADIALDIAATRPIIALVHHPLALETGLTSDRARALRQGEQAALAFAQAVVATSPATADILAQDYCVDPRRISVALPGIVSDRRLIQRAYSSRPPPQAQPLRLLSVGSLIPRKGYLDLVAALKTIADLDWTAEFVGETSLDPAHAAEVTRSIVAAGLDDRIVVTGPLADAELEARFGTADCFVLASRYEGYGMAFAEAIARGLPVIGTTGAAGAIGNGGVVVPPGDILALSVELRRVVSDPLYRNVLSVRAQCRGLEYPKWHDTAMVIIDCVERAVRAHQTISAS